MEFQIVLAVITFNACILGVVVWAAHLFNNAARRSGQ